MALRGSSNFTPVGKAEKETIDSLSRKVVVLERNFENQNTQTQNIIVGVLVASFLVFMALAFQNAGIDKQDRARSDHLLERVHSVELMGVDLQGEIDSIRARNPYLK